MAQNVAVSAAINNLHACYIGKWLQRLWTVGTLGNVKVQTSYKRRQIGVWRSRSWWVNDGMQMGSCAGATQPNQPARKKPAIERRHRFIFWTYEGRAIVPGPSAYSPRQPAALSAKSWPRWM